MGRLGDVRLLSPVRKGHRPGDLRAPFGACGHFLQGARGAARSARREWWGIFLPVLSEVKPLWPALPWPPIDVVRPNERGPDILSSSVATSPVTQATDGI